MRNKIGFLKNAIAKINGYFSRSGEKLVSARLSQEEVDAFNDQRDAKQVESKQAKPKSTGKKSVGKRKDGSVSASSNDNAVPVVHAVKEQPVAVAVEEKKVEAPAAKPVFFRD